MGTVEKGLKKWLRIAQYFLAFTKYTSF